MKNSIRRAVCYALLLVCLCAAMLAVFLPYAAEQEGGRQISILSVFNRVYAGPYAVEEYCQLGLLVLAICVLILLGRSCSRVLQALAKEDDVPQQLNFGCALSLSAVFGLLLFAVPLIAFRNRLDELLTVPTVWPAFYLAFHIAAFRLRETLNGMLRPSAKLPDAPSGETLR